MCPCSFSLSLLAFFKPSSRFGRKNKEEKAKSKAKQLGALSEEEMDRSEPEMFLSKYVGLNVTCIIKPIKFNDKIVEYANLPM